MQGSGVGRRLLATGGEVADRATAEQPGDLPIPYTASAQPVSRRAPRVEVESVGRFYDHEVVAIGQEIPEAPAPLAPGRVGVHDRHQLPVE